MPDRLALIQEPQFRERLVKEATAIEIAEHVGQVMASSRFALPCSNTFWMGTEECPNYAQSPDSSLTGLAAKAGEHPAETWLRLQLDLKGPGLFHVRFVNEDLTVLPRFLGSD